MKKRISPAQRRHMDYLRRKGLAVGKVYMARLEKARTKEVRRVLGICRDYDDVTQWGGVIDTNLSEAGYIFDWYRGLYLEAGLPQAASTVRDLTRGKAAGPGGVWERVLAEFASTRCGQNIVSVTGTLRDTLKDIIRKIIIADPNTSVERMTREVQEDFGELNAWQCRRIAQTETMIGLAEAADVAARDTEIPFLKQWCISGVGNTRETHEAMDGIAVEEQEYFVLPDCELLYPHDISTGAPASEIANCACSCIRIPK